jgi:hypothetical protein
MHYGIGSFGAGDQRLRAFSARTTMKLRALERDRWGLRFRLTGVIGTYDFSSLGQLTLDHLQTFAVVPGIEFQIPLGDRATLRPYQDVGVGRAVDSAQTFAVGSTGILAEFVFPWNEAELGLESSVQYSFSAAAGELLDEDFGNLVLRGDVRRHLWFAVGRRRPVLGAYGEWTYYFSDIVIGVAEGVDLTFRRQYELGLAFDMDPRFTAWFLTIPRVTVGWSFGADASGIRVRLGDRITHLPGYYDTLTPRGAAAQR